MNPDNYVYFVLENNSNPSWSFTGYSDKETGEVRHIYKGRKDKKFGHDLPHRFKFDRAHRTIRVHKKETDINGISVVEHIRDFPECKDSINGTYVGEGVNRTQIGWAFREIKEEEDAITAIEAKLFKNKADNVALSLVGEELGEMALLCGIREAVGSVMKLKIMDYASAHPDTFLELYKSPLRTTKALLAKAVKAGEVKVQGTIYMWKEQTIGVNEDMAISNLIKDKDLADALAENIKANGNG